MQNRKATASKKPAPARSSARRNTQPALQDAKAWVGDLRGNVKSMLGAFRRQHVQRGDERAREALAHVEAWVDELRLGVADLLPQLREARLDAAQAASEDRRQFVDSVAERVEELRTQAATARAKGQRDAAALRRGALSQRRAVLAELEAWTTDLRDQVAQLTSHLSEARQRSARAEATARREFLKQLRDDVASLRTRGPRPAPRRAPSPSPRAAQAPAPALPAREPRRAAAQTSNRATGADFLRTLRERATQARTALQPMIDQAGALPRSEGGNTAQPASATPKGSARSTRPDRRNQRTRR